MCSNDRQRGVIFVCYYRNSKCELRSHWLMLLENMKSYVIIKSFYFFALGLLCIRLRIRRKKRRLFYPGEMSFFDESICRKFRSHGKKRIDTIRALKVDGFFSRGPSDPNITIDIWNMTGWRDRLRDRRTRQARSCSKSALPARIPKHFIGICRAPRESVFECSLDQDYDSLSLSLCVP